MKSVGTNIIQAYFRLDLRKILENWKPAVSVERILEKAFTFEGTQTLVHFLKEKKEMKRPKLTEKTAQTIAEAIWKHARKCKKDFNECDSCKKGMEWFGELSLPMLSKVLSE